MPGVKNRRIVPNWLRRGFEAGVVGALLSAGTLVAFQLSRPAPRLVVPNGLDGSMILTPAVLALGVFVVVYPTVLAGTRQEAVLGVIAAFLIAADVLMLISLAQRDSVLVHALSRSLPLGVIGVALAVPVAVVSLIAAQTAAPLGFGRSAGLRSALVGALLAFAVVIFAGYSI
jgi:hypothetical protein